MADVFVFLDNVQFRKNEFQNRNRICVHGRPQWLSVPVSFRFGDLIREVRIADRPGWRKKMLRTLEHNYRRTLFYDVYAAGMDNILRTEWDNLAELNAATVRWLMKCFGITTRIVVASSLGDTSRERTKRLVEICQAVGADTYLSGSLARCYLEVGKFEDAGINVHFQQFAHPVYPQHNSSNGFVSHMSAIDGLFNCGGSHDAKGILNLNPDVRKLADDPAFSASNS